MFCSRCAPMRMLASNPDSTISVRVQNIFLIYGGNVDGNTWREVYDRPTAEALAVTVTQLPMTSVEDDVAAVQRSLDVQNGPVLLVGHSYGGVVITKARIDPDAKGFVYVTAVQPDIWESGGDLLASADSNFTADHRAGRRGGELIAPSHANREIGSHAFASPHDHRLRDWLGWAEHLSGSFPAASLYSFHSGAE